MYKVTFTPSLTQLVRYPSLMCRKKWGWRRWQTFARDTLLRGQKPMHTFQEDLNVQDQSYIKDEHRNMVASPMAQQVKNPPAMQEIQETWVQSLDQEDPLEKENGNPLQYSCLEKSHGQKRLVVQGIAKSQTQPSD